MAEVKETKAKVMLRTIDGIAHIKPEFIITDHLRALATECKTDKDVEKLSDDAGEVMKPNSNESKTEGGGPAPKIPRLSKAEKKKLRGQNKSRKPPIKFDRSKVLCNYLHDVKEGEEIPKCPNKRCSFLHSITDFMALRPADISPDCRVFNLRGYCPRGATCRFGSGHITPEGRNKIDKEKYEKFLNSPPSTVNILTKELQNDLRKRSYDFSRSEAVLKRMDNRVQSKNRKPRGVKRYFGGGPKEEEDFTKDVEIEECKQFGYVTDEDIIKLRQSEKKKIEWKGKLSMTPLTTVGNLPFRRICKEFGVDITCGEMAMAPALLKGLSQEWALVKKHHSEDIFGVQLCGNNPWVMTRAAQVLEDKFDVNFVDINIGCPIDLVYREGGGCGLMRRPRVLKSIVECMSSTVSIPVTAKIRTGITGDKKLAHTFMPGFRDWGVSLITIHGRSREQRFTRSANWDYIDECAGLASPVPVYGNGDILSYEDYKYVMDTYKNLTGVNIGRGALIKPWIFTEIKEQRLWDISSKERFEILRKYVNYGLEHWGSDNKGVENTRRFLLEWLSFLHRYIPVGLLERLPQKINERPPAFRGRDELETLMASSNCAHWIQISEMLLGPVPEGFHFLPKHKANSY